MLTATFLENYTLPPERSTDRHGNIPLPSDQRTIYDPYTGRGRHFCRWEELNCDSRVEAYSHDNVHAVPVGEELDDVIHIEKAREASGSDGIHAKVHTHGGATIVRHMDRIFLKIWEIEEIL